MMKDMAAKKALSSVGNFIKSFCVMFAVLFCLGILTDGMYLIGIPLEKDVAYVEMYYPELTEEAKVFTDSEKIELAVAVSGFLKYSVLKQPDVSEEPKITITYYLHDGESISVSANHDTVWWKGKPHYIRKQGEFMELTESVFFS